MPYRPEAELKRPDLKGEFLCGHCGKTFCHAASLNRHRLNFHGDDQQCQLCNVKIAAHETVRRHMAINHQITRVFTCGCCNWTFPDKKELHSHNNSMLRTGQPGDARAIAISNRTPGSLAQAELRPDEDHLSPSTNHRQGHAPLLPKANKRKTDGNSTVEMFYNQMLSQSNSMVPTLSPEWMSSFILNNPSLLSLFNMVQAASPDISNQESATTSADVSLLFSNNNNNNNTGKTFEEIKVKTYSDEIVSSGPDSEVGSAEEVVDTTSPVPSTSSKESTPSGVDGTFATKTSRKRKSVDAIASFLFQRKQTTSADVTDSQA